MIRGAALVGLCKQGKGHGMTLNFLNAYSSESIHARTMI